MNTTLFLAIGARIKAQCPAVKHIALYNSQYLPNMEGKSLAFAKPAVFIEFNQTQWTATDDGVQTGDGLLTIHVVLETYKELYRVFDKESAEQQALLAHYDVPRQVHAALEGFTPNGSASDLQRTTSRTDHDFDNIIVEVFEYAYQDYDNAAEPGYTDAVIRQVVANNDINKV